MSRWIEVDEKNKTVTETIADMDECKFLCNDVCCNDMCDEVAGFVDTDYCKKCPHFTEEDGIVSDWSGIESV